MSPLDSILRVFVLIPVHNRKETTLRCLRHLSLVGDFDFCQIVVIDDGSSDGTAGAVAAQFPTVEVLSGNGNLWWTGAIALGMRHACAQGATFIFWLNDDCLPERGALGTLLAFMQARPGTLTAPACYPGEKGKKEWLATGFIGRNTLAPPVGEAVEVEGLSGYCVGMPAEICRRIGLPDADRFPHYAGDGMYLLKAARAGLRTYLLGTCAAALTHYDPDGAKLSSALNQRLPFRVAFAALFLHKKSRFFLRTRYFYSLEKYGRLLGPPIFLLKAASWVSIFCACYLRHFLGRPAVKA